MKTIRIVRLEYQHIYPPEASRHQDLNGKAIVRWRVTKEPILGFQAERLTLGKM